MLVVRSALVLGALGGAVAHADRVPGVEPSEAPNHHLNMRVGGFAYGDLIERPVLCLEVEAAWSTSVEGCGTGSGFLFDPVDREIAHFRLNIPLVQRLAWGGAAALRGGVGFAELEVGDDRPGFRFGDPDAPERGSVAGPDASLSLRWLRPMGRGVEMVASATAGIAWFAGADRLVFPQARVQPYVALELGAGW